MRCSFLFRSSNAADSAPMAKKFFERAIDLRGVFGSEVTRGNDAYQLMRVMFDDRYVPDLRIAHFLHHIHWLIAETPAHVTAHHLLDADFFR